MSAKTKLPVCKGQLQKKLYHKAKCYPVFKSTHAILPGLFALSAFQDPVCYYCSRVFTTVYKIRRKKLDTYTDL